MSNFILNIYIFKPKWILDSQVGGVTFFSHTWTINVNSKVFTCTPKFENSCKYYHFGFGMVFLDTILKHDVLQHDDEATRYAHGSKERYIWDKNSKPIIYMGLAQMTI